LIIVGEDVQTDAQPGAWLMLAAGDDRPRRSNDGYDDSPATHYSRAGIKLCKTENPPYRCSKCKGTFEVAEVVTIRKVVSTYRSHHRLPGWISPAS
jgi:hypothetical protein